jgi:very-short-patch-repair endonuclease
MRNADDPNVRARTRGLIEYLGDFARSHRRPVRDCARYESVAWLADLTDSSERSLPDPGRVLASIEYQGKRPNPEPPSALEGWLDPAAFTKPGPEDPQLARQKPSRESQAGDADPEAAVLVAPEILRAYSEWLPAWREWAQYELDAEPCRRLHRQLTQMSRWAAQADDRYEAVLGVGLLTRQVPRNRQISRHVVSHRVSVIVDKVTWRVDVVLADDGEARFEDRDFLVADDGYVAERVEHVREELADQAYHPLSEDTWQLLRSWTERAFDEAVRCDESWGSSAGHGEELVLTMAPAIILRERDTGSVIDYYDRIAGSLNDPTTPTPLGLAQLVDLLSREERVAWDGPRARNGHRAAVPLAEALLPLPANHQQQDVLERMYSDTAVVVQGPPGTGKTHTIANLICALLSQGLRVLVTSQKDQALRELRDKLPAPVRDLCVMLTGVSRDGTGEFERSVTALTDRLSAGTAASIEREIRQLSGQRKQLLGRESELRAAILASREAEWTEHAEIAPGYGGTLAAITSMVIARASRCDWLPPLPPGRQAASTRPPLQPSEAIEFHNLLLGQTSARLARRAQRIPDLNPELKEDRFEGLVQGAREADTLEGRSGDIVRALASLGELLPVEVTRHVEAAAAAAHRMLLPTQTARWDPRDWRTQALSAMLSARRHVLWKQVSAGVRDLEEAQRLLASPDQPRVAVPDAGHDQTAALIRSGERLHAYLAGGGKLRRRMPPEAQRNAQEFLGSCRVDGQPPASARDVGAILDRLRAAMAIASAEERWEATGMRFRHGTGIAAAVASLTERHAQLAEIERIVMARDAIDAILTRRGHRLSLLAEPEGWDALCAAVPDAIKLSKRQQFHVALGRYAGMLPGAVPGDPPELGQLRQAVRAKDAPGFRRALAGLEQARREQADQQRCDELLGRLSAGHPELARLLADTATDDCWPGRLRSLPEAWSWRIAEAFCGSVRDPGHDRELQQDLDQVQSTLRRVTEDLVAAQAWQHCLNRVTAEQRSALYSVRTAMSRVGKGTGRYAEGHRSAARSAMRVARGAVPAWIMPIQKVAEIIPAEQDAFDVVIIDEASQAGLEALFLTWLAPRVIAVGDDKQCAPGYSAQEHQRHYDRLRECLRDLPDHERNVFAPDANLYEILSTRFPQVIRLEEHFRCMPEIIGWSSRKFYNDSLIPLRQFGADRLEPLKVVHVQGGHVEGRDGNIRNEPEAKLIVEKLRELLEDPAYATDPKKFGIIALQGTGQAPLIEGMILDSFEPSVVERHDIRVGTPPDFQGAERDVIMLSMVIAEPRQARTQLTDQRRYNVAASRARDQMWLFTSVKRDGLSRDDLRYSLLEYMEAPPSPWGESPALDQVSPDEPQDPFDSLFEQRVFRTIRQRGYHVIPQLKVGRQRRIDLVVSGSSSRLAVECDGRIAHRTPAQVRDDMERERELRRAGWKFWRVRDSEFSFNPERAMESLWAELARLGIHPEDGRT